MDIKGKGDERMTGKQNPSAEQIVCRLINSMMNTAEPNALSRALFEISFVKEGYPLDWNKGLNDNGEWVDKKELKE